VPTELRERGATGRHAVPPARAPAHRDRDRGAGDRASDPARCAGRSRGAAGCDRCAHPATLARV